MSSILRVVGTTKKYGGDLYEDELEQALREKSSVTSFSPVDPNLGKISGLPRYISNLRKIKSMGSEYDFILRPMNHTFFIDSHPKQVVIGYHFDMAFCHPLVKMHHYLGLKSMLLSKNNIHRLIVISTYWQDFYSRLGFKNIELLYCGFDLNQFNVSDSEVDAFKEKHKLFGKKIVYIGNAQKKKGADIVFEALKDSDYFLVTSGNKDIDLPVMNLSLQHRDYLCLLKAAGLVVTYSQFKEGWNRVAHEAMLLKTPVLGSGLGGMGELLAGGGQGICSNPMDLRKKVDLLYNDKDRAAQGYEFAKKFTMEKFNCRALDIFSS